MEGSKASTICPSGTSSMQTKKSAEHWWTDSDRGKMKYLEKTPAPCYIVHHKSHMVRTGIEPWPPRWKTGD